MKVFKISLLAALISSPLAAEEIDKTWELGLFADYVKSSTNKEDLNDWNQIEAGKSLGIDLQKIINDTWNVRFEAARTLYEIENGNDSTYENRTGVDAIYKLEDSDLYLFTGVKRFNNVKSYNAVNIGAGYNYSLSNRFSLYSEAAIYKDVNYGYVDQGIKIGFKYAFGDAKAAPIVAKSDPVVNTDNDNDGVSNAKDRCENTPAGVKVDSMGCTMYKEETAEISLNINFANNSSIVEPSLIDDIQRLADFMKEYPNTNTAIEGHTSVAGDADYNLMLSQKRADAVKNILVNDFGIDSSRLTAEGFGETRLLTTGTSIADNTLNRRVVAKIEATKKAAVTK